MMGLMQEWPLLISKLIEYAERYHGGREIVTYGVEGGTHRTDYETLARRSRQLAEALTRLGVQPGDRVGTLAWNTWRHMELWFGVAGMGAVSHTINPRLFPEQIAYINQHAEDKVLCFDTSFVPLVEALAEHLAPVQSLVVLCSKEDMPDSRLDLISYEELIAQEPGTFAWPSLDENWAAGLCYTSGTTGNPKGVLYSNRSTVLHAMASCMTDTIGLSNKDSVLPVVPMFHANAWGIPYGAALVGARLVFNGPHHDGETIQRIIETEQVTKSAAVPTIWLGLLDHLRRSGKRLDSLKDVTIGGSAAPRAMIEAFQKEYGVEVNHAWGMTELSPLGTLGTLSDRAAALSPSEQLDMKCKQGRGIFGVELKIVDAQGREQPRDGDAFGHLLVRGPWTVREYFRHEGGDILDQDGWFDTGDVATLDPLGYMQITDRSKDVIKSGGEWISSIDLENLAVGHPDIAEAAVIGIPHPKWDERPLLIVVPQDGAQIDKAQILSYLSEHIAKWQLPDDIVTVTEIPHTATGKIQKTALRDQFREYRLPTA
ncbi:MAG: 3-(methylthio)propionyl-CoA ligase [Rhodothalassiaceae bacterium]